MRKWWIAAAIVGASGIAALLFTDKAKESIRRWLGVFEIGATTWDDWNEASQVELEQIQTALDQIARGLEPPRSEPGR